MRYQAVSIVRSGRYLLPLLLACATGPVRAADLPNPLQLAPHHVSIIVADLEKESLWYEQVLGFQKVGGHVNGPDHAFSSEGIPGYTVDLVYQKGSSRPAPVADFFEQGYFHVVFQTPAIDAVYKRLMDLKTDVVAHRDGNRPTINRLTFHDPEGNELEIVAQAPQGQK